MSARIDLDPFVSFSAETAHPDVVRWQGRDAVCRNIREELAELVEQRVDDPKYGERYAKACQIEGTEPKDYQSRLMDLGADGEAIVGIHFRRRKLSHPFIGVTARTQPLESREQVERMTARIAEEFACFSPVFVRFFQSTGASEIALDALPKTEPDFRVIVGAIDELRKRRPPEGMDRVELEPAWETDFWDEHQAMYHRFHAEEPRLRDHVQIPDRQEVKACADARALFKAFVGSEWAGTIGGITSCAYGLRGFVVIVEILDTPYRRQRLAPVLQRHFIDRLPSTEGGLICGTIDPRNQASMRTALRMGRVDVGGGTFFPTGNG